VPLEPGAQPLLIAGDGGPFAAAAYVVPADSAAAARPSGAGAPTRYRVALVDVPRGEAVGVQAAGAPGQSVTGLAVATDATGPLVYLGLWGSGAPGGLAAARHRRSGAAAGGRRARPVLGGLHHTHERAACSHVDFCTRTGRVRIRCA
jgi:hypothetical protein